MSICHLCYILGLMVAVCIVWWSLFDLVVIMDSVGFTAMHLKDILQSGQPKWLIEYFTYFYMCLVEMSCTRCLNMCCKQQLVYCEATIVALKPLNYHILHSTHIYLLWCRTALHYMVEKRIFKGASSNQ